MTTGAPTPSVPMTPAVAAPVVVTAATEVRLTLSHFAALLGTVFAVMLTILGAALWIITSTVSKADFLDFKTATRAEFTDVKAQLTDVRAQITDVRAQITMLTVVAGDNKALFATMAERQAQTTKAIEALAAELDARKARP